MLCTINWSVYNQNDAEDTGGKVRNSGEGRNVLRNPLILRCDWNKNISRCSRKVSHGRQWWVWCLKSLRSRDWCKSRVLWHEKHGKVSEDIDSSSFACLTLSGGTTALQNPIRECVLRNNCQEIIIMKFISILTVFPMLSLLTMMRLGDSHLHVVFCVLLLAALEIAQKFKCQTVLLEMMFTFYHAHISTSPAFESFAKAEGIYSYLFFIIQIPTVSWKGRVRALSSQILIS